MHAVIPACGTATRMGGIPKMLLPTPKGTLFELLLSKMTNVDEAHVGSMYPTYDVLQSLYGGVCKLHNFAPTRTMAETLIKLSHFTGTRSVVFGMPDTYFDDEKAYSKLQGALLNGAQVAVGVFKARSGQHTEGGMCVLDGDRVIKVVDKSTERVSEWIWGVLAWTPDFWVEISERDPHVGYSVQRAIEREMPVRAVRLAGEFWDAGTPDRYFTLLDELRGR